MSLLKRSRGERDASPSSDPTGPEQRLYFIFDDWEYGYSIREIILSYRPRHQLNLRPLEHQSFRLMVHKRLPRPCIYLEAMRGRPNFFAAVGTNIIAAHPRKEFSNGFPVVGCFLTIVDGSSRSIRFGPGLLDAEEPTLIPVGDEKLFALDQYSFRMLSMELLPSAEWSWCDLPPPPINIMCVTSFAVGSDGQTILVSTHGATFVFDIVNSEWKQCSNCSLPFAGPAYYVHALDIFVGLSKAPDTCGHLCFCRKLGSDENASFGKECLLTKDPAVNHMGAKLIYMGGSDLPGFCLVECVIIIPEGQSVMQQEEFDQLMKRFDEGGGSCGELDQLENLDEGDGASGSMQECGGLDELDKFFFKGDDHRYLYRLTTFCLGFDNNGDLTTGETCVVQYYKVPKKVSKAIFQFDPVAFSVKC